MQKFKSKEAAIGIVDRLIVGDSAFDPVPKRRHSSEHRRGSHFTIVRTKGSDTDQNICASIVKAQRAAKITTASSLSQLVEPIGADVRFWNGTKPTLAFRIRDALHVHLKQVLRRATVRGGQAEAAGAQHLIYQRLQAGVCHFNNGNILASRLDRQLDQGHIVCDSNGVVVLMHDPVIGPLGIGHRVDVRTAQIHLGAVRVLEAMGSSQNPVGPDQRATTIETGRTAISRGEQVRLERDLTLLSRLAKNDGWSEIDRSPMPGIHQAQPL